MRYFNNKKMLIVGFCSGFISELSASVKTNSNDELLIEDFFFWVRKYSKFRYAIIHSTESFLLKNETFF